MDDSRTDAELLGEVRAGDRRAYESLWRRHSHSAHRYALHLFPSRADDLVSESFLVVYQTVTRAGKGPEFAFRPYLKAVMRNTAIRWQKEMDHLTDDEDVEQIDPRDGLSIVEQQASAGDVLAALQELPDRWQRVLWLAEIAEVGRGEIARELGIKPNAVSALQRRARSGLKYQWLLRQIPVGLRDDSAHVARLIPRYLTEPGDTAVSAEVAAHLVACMSCDDLVRGMRGAAARLQGSTLAVLLGSAGVGLPAVASLSSGTAAAVAAVSGIGIPAWLLVGGIGALTAGTLALAPMFAAVPDPPAPPRTQIVAEPAPGTHASSSVPPLGPPSSSIDEEAPMESLPVDDRTTGRHIEDPSVPNTWLSDDPTQEVPIAPDRPVQAGPDVPGPDPGSVSGPSPGLTSPVSSSGYLSPVISGRTAPGTGVALSLDSARYAPTVADDGTWTFDMRTLQLGAGTYEYEVWAFDEESQSAASTGSFTVLPLLVQGFEQLTGFEDMTVTEASTTGLVVAFTGPANGRVFVASMAGPSAVITLDAEGHARRRLLTNSRGWYYFTFRALDADEYWGPGTEVALDVYDPDIIFDPWGPPPEEMTFEFVDPGPDTTVLVEE
ncbi:MULTISPECIES: sigma-70 family RNA polymerase sigma factor [Bacteria]|uniref:RNA polymerase sigma factor n=1 Tax=Bacteria TaxID=2 RepID=UPI003C79E045